MSATDGVSTYTKSFTVVTACTAPSISVHPASLTKTVGESADFSVTASGTAPLTYQWRKNGSNIGTNSPTYSIASVVVADAGNYDVVVTNSCGTATSNTATLTVNKATATVSLSNLTQTYTGSVLTPTAITNPAGLTIVWTNAPKTNVGSYSVTATVSDANYQGSANDTFEITALGITATFTAADKEYDGNTDATITGCKHVGAITGDDVSCDYSGASAAFDNKNAGTDKNVSGTGFALAGDDAGNFSLISVADTTADINQRPITVTADAKVKILNASEDPALTYQVTSGFLVQGDSFSGNLTRVAGESIGTYAILQGTLTAGPNYAITYVGANLTIVYSTGSCLGGPGHQILQPINVDGTSIFKQKSTVPAKFRVCDANGNSIGTAGVVASFRLVDISGLPPGTVVNEPVDSTTPDTAFRWSASDQQWIFNINTKNLFAGKTYVYLITLNDGSTIQFQCGLK